jgi:tetratricopeptide (TPR) repeat protein
MMQGHRLAALGLAMQAVIAKPVNLNYQNNMAALLTENGYPENAIPYLNTLQQLVPGNSTVKNNLGYAWLNLGEIDSAQRILTAAAALNPENTDTKTGEGVIQEKKGNTEEAGKNYEEAFVKAPSTLILDLLNNAGKGNPYDDKTADEIKSKLTVYEYFKKDWVSYPDLSNSVSGYEKDTSIQEGYGRMFVSYTAKLQKIYDTIKNSKYGDIFIPTAKGEMYGKLAQIIVTELKKIQQLYITRPGLSENLEAAKESLKKAISDLADIKDFNVRCKKEDQLRSNYLVEVNTLIKKYFLVLNEKNRFWINAFITYNLLTNHQYKEHLMEVVFYVESYVGSVAIGIYDLETDPGCENLAPLKPSKANINEPPLPKLLCPVNINANTVSNNYNDISKSATGTAPNATVAIGSAEGEIAEPGRAGTPSVCTSQGDVCSNGINEQDEYGEANQCIEETKTAPPTEPIKGEDGLKPLAEQLMAQEAETKAKPSTGKRQAYDDYVSDALLNILKKHNLRKWLQNQLSTDCDDLKPMEQDAPPPPIDIKNELDNVANGLQEMANQLTQQNNPADAQKLESVKTLLDEIQNAQQCIDKKSKTDPGWAKKYNQLTVSPTINNSLQAPNSNPTFIKGMFN